MKRSPHTKPSPHRGRMGQAVLLLLALLFAMVAMTIWVVQIGGFSWVKLRVQDGGDAAALAAARWQAAGLNLCGELNLIQAYMLADDQFNFGAANALHGLRQRICLTAPLLGLLAAQQVAEKNGIPPIEPQGETRAFLLDSAQYAMFDDFGEEAPQVAAEFQEMMWIIANQPIRAYPLTPIIDPESGSMLANQDFYEAILGKDWCWFWFNCYSFMQQYRSRGDFGPVPQLNSEPFFGLRLATLTMPFDTLLSDTEAQDAGPLKDAMDHQLLALDHPTIPPPPPPADDGIVHPAQIERKLPVRWSVYDAARWDAWTPMHHGELPIEGNLYEKYDYQGASAAVSVMAPTPNLSGGISGYTSWMAAAKPFGDLDGYNPTLYSLALGGFKVVRLIPLDAADAGIRGFNLEWLRHLRFHVQDYARRGTTQEACRYCRALLQWESAAFRTQGLNWLREFGHTCKRPRPGRAMEGGGALYGH